MFLFFCEFCFELRVDCLVSVRGCGWCFLDSKGWDSGVCAVFVELSVRCP